MTQAPQPLVSIIVPVYNVERYVDECLASIRAQTYANLEILLVEDCSTDGSLQALEAHLEDPRVRLIRHERNGGLSAARNTGIESAGGDYVMFVDSDDVLDMTLVAACVSCAQRTGTEVVTYECKPFMDGEAIAADVRSDEVPVCRPVTTEYFSLPHFAWLKFIRSDRLRDPGLRFPVGLCYEDWPFHWRLGFVAQDKRQLDARLYHYRQRPTSITGSTGRKLLDLFAVHARVIEMLEGTDDPEAGCILAGKIRDSHWSVLTRIDAPLLGEALALARDANRALRSRALHSDGAWRRRTIEMTVRLPAPLSAAALRLLRSALGALSVSRRGKARGAAVESLT